MPFSHHQFTYYGNEDAEKFLNRVLTEVCELFQQYFTEEQTAALILIGGYGRGEGGVLIKEGTYRPHNNLDLLYIYHKNIDKKILHQLDESLQKISKKYDIGIDLSAISKKKLNSFKGLVLSYDMRYGHRTLLGDSSFIQDNRDFSIYNIDPVDIRQLLVNRGTLMLINALLLKKEHLTEKEKKLIIKHNNKAIIGYGDALLFFNNQYHWSYAHKLSNMNNLFEIDQHIKELYSGAITFRFKPDYETYLKKDLIEWHNDLLKTFKNIHLECEKIHLAQLDLSWATYIDTALTKGSYPSKNIKQKIKYILEGLKHPIIILYLASPIKILHFLQMGNRGMISLIFPYIAYANYPLRYKKLFKLLLKTDASTHSELLNAFLIQWSKWGDTNFKNVLKSYNITLEKR